MRIVEELNLNYPYQCDFTNNLMLIESCQEQQLPVFNYIMNSSASIAECCFIDINF